jgi:DNA polymerase I-like protein with 3'-5' exonuclease and polymerase domains
MSDCRKEEAEKRAADPTHPWYNRRLRRSRCNKALNALIQGGAARQTKMSMRACWQEKLVPLLQMHDELAFSFTKEKDGERVAEIMRDIIQLRVPMKVDAEWGKSWGTAKLPFSDALRLINRGRSKTP